MTENVAKISANSLDMIQLLSDSEVRAEFGEAFAAVMVNPTVTWAKFILTDDRTNGNGQRIPKEEFANLLRSGVHMPVKMAIGEISPGHPNTKPLGTITHLKEISTEDGASAIIAIAALWSQERPADVEFIKERFASRKPVDVSWEILYEDSKYNEELSSIDLFGTVLRAATIVGNPAYEGRTPFLSISAKKKSEAAEEEIKDSPDTIAEVTLETTELKSNEAELQTKLDEALAEIESQKTLVSEKDAKIAELEEKLTAIEPELQQLREFKASLDAEVEKQEKLIAIKTKFDEAGLKKDDQYFADNAEKLLGMGDDTLEFLIQEVLANLSDEQHTSTASKKSIKIPNLPGEEDEVDYKDPKVLGKYLRERGKK